MKWVTNRKHLLLGILLAFVLAFGMLTGCSSKKDDTNKVRDLDFTVVGEKEIPDELRQMIDEKKAAPFKLTYSNDQGMYIVVGYGSQSTGGYSIAVKDLYLTDNSIVFDTDLIGPEKGTVSEASLSYPYIVVKTEYLELPVVFQ